MTFSTHLTRVVALMVAVGGWLAWKSDHASIVFADSLRYINQAKQIDGGDAVHALFHAIDHPAYPLAIAAAHRMIGGITPEAWQVAGQTASVVAAVLLVVPLYLVAFEMFGGAVAALAVILSFLVPISGQVMADALSESWFLLFFTFGVWAAIRFLKQGAFAWLPCTVGFSALAYWVRPEALLLPAALVATLAVIPLMKLTRLHWPRWWAAVGFLVIGPALLIAPIVASKGGISTKPAVGRVLGTVSRSAPSAVERQRPLKPDQTTRETYILATRAMAMAVRDSVTVPLFAPGAARVHPGLAPGGKGPDVGFPDDRDGRLVARHDPPVRHRGLLHPPARPDPGLSDTCGVGLRVDPAPGDGGDPRSLVGPARWSVHPGAGRFRRQPGGPGLVLSRRPPGPDQQPVRRLSPGGRIPRSACPARREGRRRDRLGPCSTAGGPVTPSPT